MNDNTSGEVLFDRTRRQMGFIGPEEGAMDEVDRLELAKKRGQLLNAEPVTLDSIRQSMGFPCKGEVL